MTRSRVLVALTGGCLLLGATVTAIAVPKGEKSSAESPIPVAQKIALLDLNFLLKNHAELKAMKEEMQKDVQREEEHVKREKLEIKALQKRLGEAMPGSEQYPRLQKEIDERMALLNVDITLQRKAFLKQEATIYYKVHQQILDEVRAYARANQITAILKYDSEEASLDVPESIVRRINSSVVYCEEGLDITPMILARINDKAQ